MGAAELFNSIAETYQEKFMDFDLYNDTYDSFCDLLTNTKSEILELACGPGNITRYLLRKNPDLKILATDLAPEMIRLTKINNPSTEVELLDCRRIDQIERKFDAVICGFCMPYLTVDESEKLMHDCSKLLNRGGLFYFSTIEGEYSDSKTEKLNDGNQVNLYFYNATQLKELLELNNFNVVHIFRKDYLDRLNQPSVHLVMIARRKL